MNRLTVGLCLLLTISIAACGASKNPSGDGGDKANNEEAVVVITGDVVATVREVDADNYPDRGSLVSPVFDIGPNGTMFPDTPAIVGIPINPGTPAGTNIVVARYNEITDAWDALDGSYIVGETVFAPTEHFSIFAALGALEATCDNVWSGGPGAVAPLLIPDSVVVAGAVRTEQVISFSGPSAFATSSTWTHPGCSATVTGNFAAAPGGDGAWVDYSNAGQGGAIPHNAGAFSFTLNAPSGPFLGLADACQAGVGAVPYFLNVHFTGNCVGLCQGVTCNADDGNPCTTDTCNPQTGTCEQTPSNGTCGSANGGLCVQGLCMVEVPQLIGETGRTVCASQGLVCDSTPVLDPPQAACVAFHPTATVVSDGNGWREGFYCDDNTNAACGGKVNECHDCPACTVGNLGCTLGNTTQIESVFASCVP